MCLIWKQWRIQKSLVEGDVVEAGRSKATRGMGSGTPSHRERVWGVPPPQIFFSILDLKMASFCALWVPVGGCIPLILPLDLPLYGNIIGAPVQHLVYFGTELALYDQE